jgi:glutaredoxin-related protein
VTVGNLKVSRFISVSKAELILGCVASLVNASNQVLNHKIHFKILDDNSSQETLNQLHLLFKQSKHSYEFVELSGSGSHYTALKQFELCRDSNADLVYSIEDDYLHCPTALKEALEEFIILTAKVSNRKTIVFVLMGFNQKIMRQNIYHQN